MLAIAMREWQRQILGELTARFTNMQPRQRPARDALVGCCSEAVADRSGSDGQVAPSVTNQQSVQSLGCRSSEERDGRTEVPAAWREQVGALPTVDTGAMQASTSRPSAVAERERSLRSHGFRRRDRDQIAGRSVDLQVLDLGAGRCCCPSGRDLCLGRRGIPRARARFGYAQSVVQAAQRTG